MLVVVSDGGLTLHFAVSFLLLLFHSAFLFYISYYICFFPIHQIILITNFFLLLWSRSFQNFISSTNPETLAALNNGNTDGMSPGMVKTAMDVVGKMPPEELQRMVQLASSIQGGNPFSGGGPGSIPSDVSPDTLKMATEVMSKMSPEDFQRMFNMASSFKGTGAVSSSASANANGYRSQSRTRETQIKGEVSGNRAEETSTSQGFSSSTVPPQSSLTGLSGDLQEQMRNQMNDPAMRQVLILNFSASIFSFVFFPLSHFY